MFPPPPLNPPLATWEDSGTPTRFFVLLLGPQYAHQAPFALPWRLHCVNVALARAPTLCACFEHAQNKRQGLALKVAHGHPIAPLTRHQIALRDLVSLCLGLLYFRTRSGSAIMIVGRCDCNLFLMVYRHLPKLRNRLMRSQNTRSVSIVSVLQTHWNRSESAARTTWAHWERKTLSTSALRAYWNHTENAYSRGESEPRAYCDLL